jgi:hypothetical protein
MQKQLSRVSIRLRLSSLEGLVEIQQIIVGIHHEMVLTGEIRQTMLHSTEIAVIKDNRLVTVSST